MDAVITKTVRLFFAYFMVLISATLSPRIMIAGAVQSEKEQIKETVEAYFDIRYRSYKKLQLEDFQALVSETSLAREFLLSESDKLEIELQHLKRNQLRYTEVEYFLDFVDISINSATQMAAVSVIEGHDVVFEISTRTSLSEPRISSMRNLQHLISLHWENGVWKIISDEYEDYIWRVINNTGMSKEEYLSFMVGSQDTIGPTSSKTFGTNSLCSLPDDPSSYPYNRSGAIDYAHQWAVAPRPYNTKYFDYTDYGGDCTNFVSQAVYEGGAAQMVGEGTYGWYYNSANDHAAAWTGVIYFYKFITAYDDWSAGPEGCEVAINQAYPGDMIQYDWTDDRWWDHSVIIVDTEDYLPSDRYYWVAGHSPDVDYYPFEYFSVDYPDMDTRFLHIERLDGFSIYLPLILKRVSSTIDKTHDIDLAHW
jgi:hypothetical protein